jgi:hypothetical protein
MYHHQQKRQRHAWELAKKATSWTSAPELLNQSLRGQMQASEFNQLSKSVCCSLQLRSTTISTSSGYLHLPAYHNAQHSDRHPLPVPPQQECLSPPGCVPWSSCWEPPFVPERTCENHHCACPNRQQPRHS